MKRFKKFYPAAVLMMVAVLLGSGFTAAAAKAPTTPKPAAAKVVCKLPATLKLSGTKFVLPAKTTKTTGCWLVKGSTKKPLKFSVYVVEHFADVLGPVNPPPGIPPYAVCAGMPTSNTAPAVKLFVNPTRQYRGSMWPGYSFGTLSISAKSGKLKGSAVRKWSRPNTDAHFFCGPPAKLAVHQEVYAVDQTPPAPTCVWDVYPKMNGLSAGGGTVGCTVPSGGSCKWTFQGFRVMVTYLQRAYMLQCVVDHVNYDFEVNIKIEYSTNPGANECPPRLIGYLGGGFVFPSNWGKGVVSYSWGVANLTSSEHYPNGSISPTLTFQANGTTDPCITDLK
ncbi:MAG: hypothetical protein Q7R60_03525 [bacterium]|nr:hypothetical protein [bacterium]